MGRPIVYIEQESRGTRPRVSSTYTGGYVIELSAVGQMYRFEIFA